MLSGLLLWQRDLRGWPTLVKAPDATPIVSLYSQGKLCGCAGMTEGLPEERLARAFVQALGDGRFGGLGSETRATLRAQVSYALHVEKLAPEHAAEQLEVGTHGLAVASTGLCVSLLPDVARDNSLDAEGMLATLEGKGGMSRTEWPRDGLYSFETDSVLATLTAWPELHADSVEAAASWLAQRVDADGKVAFGVNPRSGCVKQESPMYHGRAAILLRALSYQKRHRPAALRARRWLRSELKRALAGETVPQFPGDPAVVAGTLALADLAEVEMREALTSYARRPETTAQPWYASQVVAALGAAAPDELWIACRKRLETEHWAPWTAIAAHAIGDSETLARAVAGLVASVREHGPHVGGVGPGSVPELARTAATVEALQLVSSKEARNACERARRFLVAQQLDGACYAPSRDPLLVHGAFPQTPVHDFLQVDVTGHALLALSPNAVHLGDSALGRLRS